MAQTKVKYPGLIDFETTTVDFLVIAGGGGGPTGHQAGGGGAGGGLDESMLEAVVALVGALAPCATSADGA